MTNKEKYRDKIENCIFVGDDFAVDRYGNIVRCNSIVGCKDCIFGGAQDCASEKFIWLCADYAEPNKPKYSKYSDETLFLKKNDKVMVSSDGTNWKKRYFSRYDEKADVIYCFGQGANSWNGTFEIAWEYVRLPEDTEL